MLRSARRSELERFVPELLNAENAASDGARIVTLAACLKLLTVPPETLDASPENPVRFRLLAASTKLPGTLHERGVG